ncbi:MAG TPA: hypothetical protein PLF19_14520, partial [Ottowia sp.]|nr:hypothetical protein [Ottowia sp.]
MIGQGHRTAPGRNRRLSRVSLGAGFEWRAIFSLGGQQARAPSRCRTLGASFIGRGVCKITEGVVPKPHRRPHVVNLLDRREHFGAGV